MLYRGFQVIATGQWINALLTVDGDEFSVTAKSHRADIAKALGVRPAELRVVDAHQSPISGSLLSLPRLRPAPNPKNEARNRALAAIKANRSVGPWGLILHDLAVADGQFVA